MKDFHTKAFELPIVEQVSTILSHGKIKYHAVIVKVGNQEKWLFAEFWPFGTITNIKGKDHLFIEYLVKPDEVNMFLDRLLALVEKSSCIKKIALVAEGR